MFPETLASNTLALIGTVKPRGNWVTATAYAVGDAVLQGSGLYLCTVAHTSGVFATDLAAGKWMSFSGTGTAASNITVTPVGSLAATNAQSAFQELDADLTAHIGMPTGAHAASAIANTPAGNIAATTVQAALNELDSEKAAAASPTFTGTIAGAVVKDDTFRIADNADTTKRAAFEVSRVAAAATRTINVPDYDCFLANLMPGTIVDFAGPVPPTGWLVCDGSSVAVATYQELFNQLGYTWGGAGANFNLPNLCGRATIGLGTGGLGEGVVGVAASGNAIPVAGNITRYVTGMQVTVSGASGFVGLTNGTWYVIRVDSSHIKLATSLANAQNGVAATITGTGNATFSWSLNTRTLGEYGGEETHAMSSVELLAHSHTTTMGTATGGQSAATGTGNAGQQGINSITGGNAAMNVMQPFAVVMKIIKY